MARSLAPGQSQHPLPLPATALKMNMTLRELYLADNKLNGLQDSAQLGNLLKFNCSLQILDLRNNHVLDSGVFKVQPPHPDYVPSWMLVVLETQWWPRQTWPCPRGAHSLSAATTRTGRGCGSPGQVSDPVWGLGRASWRREQSLQNEAGYWPDH